MKQAHRDSSYVLEWCCDAPEFWLPVIEDSAYAVSNAGRVKSLPRIVTRAPIQARNHKVSSLIPVRGRILADRVLPIGYKVAGLRNATRYVHDLVLKSWRGEKPQKAQVRHMNGVKADNRESNLVYGSAAENLMDLKWHGKVRKLDPDAVVAIRRLAQGGALQREIAAEFNIDQTTVSDILLGRIHRDVALTRPYHIAKVAK
jgi:hypothetical protein